jgi:hypothetical protein
MGSWLIIGRWGWDPGEFFSGAFFFVLPIGPLYRVGWCSEYYFEPYIYCPNYLVVYAIMQNEEAGNANKAHP